jgi:hypothetical protein
MTQQYDVTMTQQMCVTSGHGSKADDSALMTPESLNYMKFDVYVDTTN